MTHLPTLISDLALILFCAGITTLLFKKMRQPLVLGYIVAGFLASPHLSFTPSVANPENIKVWSEIGVVFLLFSLGLEFSFKKLVKVGGQAIFSACLIIFFMATLGICLGWLFGWSRMDCLYLGGMLAMSSTTIIYKAFDDLGLRQKRFAGLVLSILIIEDILAIVLMVMLSTVAVSKHFEGVELIQSILKLVFFLVLWFVVGIYVVPIFLKRSRKLMSDETLLIVALALCLGMVVLAARVGYSPAFGAFIMGSILAETVESEHIERLISPVKDLFGAIFFVSVGMMVDPHLIVTYMVPICVLVLAILLGQTVLGSFSVLLSGQSLKTAIQSGFSLTQIGEFSFIIASLGMSLGVIQSHLYPIIVAVSVITTFTTPYMIRLSEPAYRYVALRMPERWMTFIDQYAAGKKTINHESLWRSLLFAVIRITVIYMVLTVAAMLVSLHFIVPLITAILPGWGGEVLGALLTIAFLSPFLRALIMKKNRSIEFKQLWEDNRFNHALLISLILIRVAIAITFVMYVIGYIFEASTTLRLGVAILLVTGMIFSRMLKKHSIVLERTFVQNLRSKDFLKEYMGERLPAYAGKLIDRDLHISDFNISPDSSWAGRTLADLNLGKKYDVHVVSILRGTQRLNIPGGEVRIFPGDTLQIIGTDDQLAIFCSRANEVDDRLKVEDFDKHEMHLKQLYLDDHSPFVGKSILESEIRDRFKCLVVGVESAYDDSLHTPDVYSPLQVGDTLWVVGEEKQLKALFTENNLIHKKNAL